VRVFLPKWDGPVGWHVVTAKTHHIARTLLIGAIAVTAAVAGVAAIAVTGGTASTTRLPTSVTINNVSCGKGWLPPRSGQREIPVTNAGSSVVDVTLVGSDKLLIYGEIEAMAPGTTRTLTAVIPPGRFRLGCTYSENATVYSSIVTVSGAAVHNAHPFEQVTYSQIAPLVTKYRAQVSAGLGILATDTDRLRALADTGQLGQAKQAWLVAHLDYARLGAAYDTFGNFNDEIDGRPNGLPQGVADPSWSGFLRLEFALWQNQPAATVASVAGQLDTYVHQLVIAFSEETTPLNDLSLRTHEILENTLQFELTGETDQGSHTGLATAEANVEGTEMILGVIAPLLRKGEPALLGELRSELSRLTALLTTYRLPNETWTPVQSLTQTQREQLDGSIGNYLETVSRVPDLLEIPPEASSP
jgi:iron uptake system EfeUOB component EfeO/EfeM